MANGWVAKNRGWVDKPRGVWLMRLTCGLKERWLLSRVRVAL